MKRFVFFVLAAIACVAAAGPALAAGGGGAPIVIVADTRHIDGIMAWWGNLYNDSHLYFAILTVVMIPIIGVIFGVLADMVFHMIGIDLTSKDIGAHH